MTYIGKAIKDKKKIEVEGKQPINFNKIPLTFSDRKFKSVGGPDTRITESSGGIGSMIVGTDFTIV